MQMVNNRVMLAAWVLIARGKTLQKQAVLFASHKLLMKYDVLVTLLRVM